MLACICVPPVAVRSHCGWPGDITPASVQVTLSRIGAQNRVYTAAQSEYGLPGRQGLTGLNVAVCSTFESTPGAQEGATAGSADNSQQEPREHLETEQKQPDGHLVGKSRVERRQKHQPPWANKRPSFGDRDRGEWRLSPHAI